MTAMAGADPGPDAFRITTNDDTNAPFGKSKEYVASTGYDEALFKNRNTVSLETAKTSAAPAPYTSRTTEWCRVAPVPTADFGAHEGVGAGKFDVSQ